MFIMGYVQVRLKYPDVSQPALKTDSDESVKNVLAGCGEGGCGACTVMVSRLDR
jgi:xanthine dehydrogenase iron-sulfur cluster and FAD-binding subunit A